MFYLFLYLFKLMPDIEVNSVKDSFFSWCVFRAVFVRLHCLQYNKIMYSLIDAANITTETEKQFAGQVSIEEFV